MNRSTPIVGFVLFVAMLGSNLPAPLYELYRVRFGTTTFATTAVFAAYPLALVATPIAFARLPDRIGRRPVLAIGIVAAAAGAIVFALARDVPTLIAGDFARRSRLLRPRSRSPRSSSQRSIRSRTSP